MSDLSKKYSYLDYLERTLDDQQIEVCCRTDNTVVAAGAGSGKTQVLASRFAWLCMEFDDIKASSILTLTFTKKAAAEMYLRIYQTLNRFANGPEDVVPARQRKNARRALEDFANVHIQTLDSYCGSIVRQGANRYGIRPDFTTGDSGSITQLALPFVLARLDNPAVLHFADAGKIQEFAEDIVADAVEKYTSLATPAGFFASKISVQRQQIVEAWNKAVNDSGNGGIKDLINTLKGIWNDSEGQKQCIKYKDTAFQNLFAEPDACYISEEDVFINKNSYVIEKIEAYISWLKGFSGFELRAGKGDFADSMKDCVKKLREKPDELTSIYNFIKDYDSILALYKLLDDFTAEINQAKRITGALTFNDVSEMALKILLEQKDIRNQEKAAYSKIMIDEFQDNNGKNRDMLFLLSEKPDSFVTVQEDEKDPDALHQLLKANIVKDKLFFVGDEKQSIYRFRNADVAVFNQLKDDLAEINGNDSYLHMIYNYRSTPELLTCFNTMFGGFIPENSDFVRSEKAGIFENESDYSFEACYPDSANARYVDKEFHRMQPGCHLNAENVPGHIHLVVNDSEFKKGTKGENRFLSANDQQAHFIASKISELVKNGCCFSDIAILDRSRTNRGTLMRWLERFQIPYNLDEQSNVFSDGPVNDIYHFLRLCIYPSDLTSFASYLCSPLAGLSESEMERILSVVQSFDSAAVERIQEKFGQDSSTFKKFKLAADFYNNEKQLVSSSPITETLSKLWYDCGYYYETMLNSSVNVFAEQFDFLFETARQSDLQGRSVASFVDQLSKIKSSEGSDIDIKRVTYPMEKKDSVQIMTVHKSKGLQFLHVFIIGCIGSGKKDKQENYFYEEKNGLSVKTPSGNSNFFFNFQKNEADKKAMAEYRRLIYVGITRAVKDFYMVGEFSVTKNGEHTENEMAFVNNLITEYYPGFWTDEKNEFYVEKAPFSLSKIQPVTIEDLNALGRKESLDDIRIREMEAALKLFEKADEAGSKGIRLISQKEIPCKRRTPSGTEKEWEESSAGKTLTPDRKDIFPEIDGIMASIRKEKVNFGWEDFGTLAHRYLELSLNGVPFEQIKIGELTKLSRIKAETLESIHRICCDICKNFSESEYGMAALKAQKEGRQAEAEYGFKMLDEENFIVTGSIDLFIENEDGTFTIVDYKTDHQICVEKYKDQQALYKKALCALTGLEEKSVKNVLYYVRFNQSVVI